MIYLSATKGQTVLHFSLLVQECQKMLAVTIGLQQGDWTLWVTRAE